MAKNTKSSNLSATLAALNALPNLHMIVRKSDQQRRLVGHNTGSVGEQLAECADPAAIGALALDNGITIDEIQRRASSAPNFGQFRMVIGNRLAAIVRRVEGGMSVEEAAYPKEARKAKREAAKLAKEATKTAKKVAKTEKKEPTAKAKKVVKVVKKTRKPRAAAPVVSAEPVPA